MTTDNTPAETERFERGMAALESLELDLGNEHGLLHGMRVHAPSFKRSTIELFGELYAGQHALALETRLLLALALAVTEPSAEGVLEFQIGAALRMGWSQTQIVELLELAAAYVGRPKAVQATRVAVRVFEAARSSGARAPVACRHEIRPMGSYFPLDADGNIVNDCRAENVPEALAAATVEYYQELFDGNLVSVYVRGSVARGAVVRGVSDFDSFAVVSSSPAPSRPVPSPAVSKHFQALAPDLRDFEFHACSIADVVEHYLGTWAFVVKTQSVCLFGKDFAGGLRPYKPGAAIMGEALYLKQRLRLYEQRVADERDEHARRTTCEWMMKALVRAAFDLSMERLHRYTRDLYLCYVAFSAVYPEWMTQASRALEWAINPTADTAPQQALVREFGEWIVGEVTRLREVHGINLNQYLL